MLLASMNDEVDVEDGEVMGSIHVAAVGGYLADALKAPVKTGMDEREFLRNDTLKRAFARRLEIIWRGFEEGAR